MKVSESIVYTLSYIYAKNQQLISQTAPTICLSTWYKKWKYQNIVCLSMNNEKMLSIHSFIHNWAQQWLFTISTGTGYNKLGKSLSVECRNKWWIFHKVRHCECHLPAQLPQDAHDEFSLNPNRNTYKIRALYSIYSIYSCTVSFSICFRGISRSTQFIYRTFNIVYVLARNR